MKQAFSYIKPVAPQVIFSFTGNKKILIGGSAVNSEKTVLTWLWFVSQILYFKMTYRTL